jgi:hypothetical protein
MRPRRSAGWFERGKRRRDRNRGCRAIGCGRLRVPRAERGDPSYVQGPSICSHSSGGAEFCCADTLSAISSSIAKASTMRSIGCLSRVRTIRIRLSAAYIAALSCGARSSELVLSCRRSAPVSGASGPGEALIVGCWTARSKAAPHSPQNFSLGLTTDAQKGHVFGSIVPHWTQNFFPSAFSAPHPQSI